MADTSASARLIGIVTTDGTNSYAKLTSLGDLTLDNIGNNLSAFSVITIPVGY
jgi:predicted phage gp36 major capsid-like protein